MHRFACSALVAVALCALLPAAPAFADGKWVIARASGDVRVHRAGGWTPVSAAPNVRPGDSIWTGRNGRVLLRHPKGVLVVTPGSMVMIPDQDYGAHRTILFQYKGQVSADVAKRGRERFEVHTPFLAAVVKGTRFTVTIGAASTIVSVESGIVQVRDQDTGQSTSLHRGRAVATDNSAGAGLSQQIASVGISGDELRAAAASGSVAGAPAASGAVGSAIDDVNPAGNVRGNSGAVSNRGGNGGGKGSGNGNGNANAGGNGNGGGSGNDKANVRGKGKGKG